MTGRDRLLKALKLEIPDRLPAAVHSWMPYFLDTYCNGIDQFQAYEKFGLDSVIYFYATKDTSSSGITFFGADIFGGPQWEVITKSHPRGENVVYEFEIITPDGILTKTMEMTNKMGWVVEYPVKHPDDFELVEKYLDVPEPNIETINEAAERLGDDGILRCHPWGHQPSSWQDACNYAGAQKMIFWAYDYPDKVHRFLRSLTDKKLKNINQLVGARIDLIEMGGGDGSASVISPDMHREFCLPYDKELNKAIHEKLGAKIVYHLCGKAMPMLDMVLENGSDAIETLTPAELHGDVDLAEIKERVGDKLCLIGGFNQVHWLTQNPDFIREKVKECFEKAGKNGGYIMSMCDHFFDVLIENVQAYANAVKEVACYQ
ncbi:MAG: uroporphyrinogen decarboxylase family protein [Actinobacteria bacterium]|nr:uroporphyrinogen decarboxylase family protein [Actinomycetota bacterium]